MTARGFPELSRLNSKLNRTGKIPARFFYLRLLRLGIAIV